MPNFKIYLEKSLQEVILNQENNHFSRHFWLFPLFSLFLIFVRFRFEKTCYRVIFRVRYENLIHKHALNHIKVENISLTFLDLVTLDDLDLT